MSQERTDYLNEYAHYIQLSKNLKEVKVLQKLERLFHIQEMEKLAQ